MNWKSPAYSNSSLNCRTGETRRSVEIYPDDFDFWFDGGAGRVLTGWEEFVFENGAQAEVAAQVPSLSVTIDFPDGRRVEIRQTRP